MAPVIGYLLLAIGLPITDLGLLTSDLRCTALILTDFSGSECQLFSIWRRGWGHGSSFLAACCAGTHTI